MYSIVVSRWRGGTGRLCCSGRYTSHIQSPWTTASRKYRWSADHSRGPSEGPWWSERRKTILVCSFKCKEDIFVHSVYDIWRKILQLVKWWKRYRYSNWIFIKDQTCISHQTLMHDKRRAGYFNAEAWREASVNHGPHSPTVLKNTFLLKTYLRSF